MKYPLLILLLLSVKAIATVTDVKENSGIGTRERLLNPDVEIQEMEEEYQSSEDLERQQREKREYSRPQIDTGTDTEGKEGSVD